MRNLLLAPTAIIGLAISPVVADDTVSVGYFDTVHSLATLPVIPPGAIVIMNGNSNKKFDGGAIRIHNPFSTPLFINSVWVNIGPQTYNPWKLFESFKLAAGQTIVLGPTAYAGPPLWPEVSNFDLSESKAGCTRRNSKLPEINISLSMAPSYQPQTSTYIDTTQVLNTGGWDKFACEHGANETHDWVPISQ